MVVGPKVATCNGKPLSPYAKKMPKTLVDSKKKKSQNANSSVNYDRLNRDAFVAIVDKLFKKQKYIMPIHTILYGPDYPVSSSEDEDVIDMQWPANGCRRLKNIPVGWMVQFLYGRLGSRGVTQELLKKLEEKTSA